MAVSEFTSGPLRDLSSKELGTGGFSDFELLSDSGHNRVYRAMTAGKWVVLKVAKEEEGNTARNRLLLQREYDIMHAIDCLYVVKTWQMTEIPKLGTAIVMEYVQGRTLDRFLQEKPSLSERRRVADELMEALAFLHERQIVHGDLKSSNILITDSGNHVRLIDFGFSDTDAYIAKIAIARDNDALAKIVELLFSGRLNYIVRAAVLRRWRLTWLLPVLIGVLVAAMIVLFRPNPVEPVPQTIEQTDTVVIVTQPAVDSAWLNLKKQAESRYEKLYRLYADSLTNMPEKSVNEGIAMTSRYASRMFEEKNKLMKAHPQYQEQLHQQYMLIYERDWPRLHEIHKDYPIVIY
ncbi:MAG: protein kinase [Paludibacteraceae bacterium]|nr:protein kinase [Paludibacteraceae bacterium]